MTRRDIWKATGALAALLAATLVSAPGFPVAASNPPATTLPRTASLELARSAEVQQKAETVRRGEIEAQPVDRATVRQIERSLARTPAETRIDTPVRTIGPTSVPTARPTAMATATPTASASARPRVRPTSTPVPRPSASQSPAPSPSPTATVRARSAAAAAATPAPSRTSVPIQRLRPGMAELVRTTQGQERAIARSIGASPEVFDLMVDDRSEIVALPDVIRQLDTDGETLLLKPYVLMARPLTYHPESETFRGAIMVGVGEVSQVGRRRELTRPIGFQVYGRGRATPAALELGKTTPPHAEIEIEVPAALAGAEVKVVSLFNPAGTAISLPLDPTLRIEAATGGIEAYGLETTEINVAVFGLENPAGRVVSLHSRPSGFLSDSRVTLDENGMASTRIRSGGVGEVTVRANMAGLAPAATRLEVRFPFLTLGAAILGGIVGALVRVLGTGHGRGGGARWRLFAASALSGIMIFALYAVGTNILPITPSVTVGATLVFAVSALGAFLGIALLEALAPPSADDDDGGTGPDSRLPSRSATA